jgi:lysophospholipase L1-like esterase
MCESENRPTPGGATRFLRKATLLLASIVIGILFYALLYEAVETVKYHRWRAQFDGFGSFGTITIASPNPVLLWEYKAYGERVQPPVIRTNRYGFRERDFDTTRKPQDVTRIAFIGDSVTLGLDVRREDTFASLVEHEANARLESPAVQTMNFGVDGYNTVQIAELLRTRVLQFAPDVVVYTLCMNDFDFEESSGRKSLYFKRPASFFLRRLQTLYRSLRNVDYYRFHHSRTHPRIYDEILTMRDLMQQEGVAFHVAVVPLFRLGRDQQDSFADYHIADLHRHVDRFLEAHRIPFVDMLEPFLATGIPGTELADDPWHPNASGHRIISAELTAALLPELSRRVHGCTVRGGTSVGL